ncbi:hypothetical protein SLEP1_g41890 [Rubroshorea leprosula]|uniref:NAD-dependent epimerase/dehydratase domain-containing protein n=1 Tax=Rubroshorea leprosula TaxID=152421 RepID=A0AAV5L809_9ROSI|nr:hypothetical protein SLEP1_g41890 [Rubroshorea leprosula]
MATVNGRVCVTGAGGFLASWVVKLLLSKDYAVGGTVRQLGDEKYAHLNKLEKASENLKLLKADLLDYDSLCSAIEGCDGVFHVASPVPSTTVPNPEVELIEPAVKGTLNVLKACLDAKVKRVVVVSSEAAVSFNPRLPEGQIKDEACWSDKEYCRTTKVNVFTFYSEYVCPRTGIMSQRQAESEALEFAKRTGLDVVTVCPTTIWGPLLQPTINASSKHLIKVLTEGYETLENKLRNIVDVRDVAEALLLAYEKPEAEGRYICTAHRFRMHNLVDKLRTLYPNYNYPESFTEGEDGAILSIEKLQTLGWRYWPLEETLVDSIESYKNAGILC